MAKIIIIGAGLTGISAAYHLEKKGIYDYKLFEKESTIGGLCGSVTTNGFTFDYTGHLLHLNDEYCKQLVDKAVGLESFNTVSRQSYVFSQNTYTRFPFQINLFGLPTQTIAECIEGYIKRPKKSRHTSFYSWVLQNFGTGFGKHFFFPYQKKIFAYNIKQITASWTGRFVPSTSLNQIIEGALSDTFDPSIGYNAQFFYPKKGGIVSWVNALASHIKNPIYTQFCVKHVHTKKRVITFTNGHTEPYDHLITTMPLKELLPRLDGHSSSTLYQATPNLICNSVVNFNIGTARTDLSSKHWIYFPEKEFPFYRLGFPHNFSATAVPPGCSSLYGEFSYIRKSKAYITHATKQSLALTKKLFSLTAHETVLEHIIHIPYAYVIYDFWREKNLPKIHAALHDFSIHSIGRYGAWKYSSMQEALLEGKHIAETLSTPLTSQSHYTQEHTIKGVL